MVNEWYVVTAGHCVARARASQVIKLIIMMILRVMTVMNFTLKILK